LGDEASRPSTAIAAGCARCFFYSRVRAVLLPRSDAMRGKGICVNQAICGNLDAGETSGDVGLDQRRVLRRGTGLHAATRGRIGVGNKTGISAIKRRIGRS
jgi:hypothetical protein